MAHYAFLDGSYYVTSVIVGKDEGEDGINWEQRYGEIRGQMCKRTSYNTRGGIYYTPGTNTPDPDQSKAFRKNYAGIGYFYDHSKDAFVPPKPYQSWNLNDFSCLWEPPVPYPQDGFFYVWDEIHLTWVKQTPPVGG